jgi:RecG-like helicase
MFVGRAGLNSKKQSTALEDFKNNKVNVLISTSVGNIIFHSILIIVIIFQFFNY